ncbi:hypothetical protein FA13DRAFT_229404 [Coprinellus micaceus]|uniref:Uncharacterized protein n=1 Tax=Coprinellus micaceus TaxID=71717 RepID=A0A4Y7TFV5_COPMI|nr:hypothetical protein FA13DRAFT_229404 [Coprinellus micaceus]
MSFLALHRYPIASAVGTLGVLGCPSQVRGTIRLRIRNRLFKNSPIYTDGHPPAFTKGWSSTARTLPRPILRRVVGYERHVKGAWSILSTGDPVAYSDARVCVCACGPSQVDNHHNGTTHLSFPRQDGDRWSFDDTPRFSDVKAICRIDLCCVRHHTGSCSSPIQRWLRLPCIQISGFDDEARAGCERGPQLLKETRSPIGVDLDAFEIRLT